jgi:hypothetical protein
VSPAPSAATQESDGPDVGPPKGRQTMTTREKDEKNPGLDKRLSWTTPKLTFVGNVGDVLQGGGGKLSVAGGDPGENRVEKPHAPG